MAGPAGPGPLLTEVVLQGFNGQLTMLDGRAGAGGGMQDGDQSDYGGEELRRRLQRARAPCSRARSGGGGGGSKPSFD